MVTGLEHDQLEIQKAIAHNLKAIAEQLARLNNNLEKQND